MIFDTVPTAIAHDSHIDTSQSLDWEARRSSIHGHGVFATGDIPQGALISFYGGKVISEEEASQLYSDGAGHTFLFARSDGAVIDGGQDGNDTRFINHGCEPNVEALESNLNIEIRAMRLIPHGEELLLDYMLVAEEEGSEAAHPCRCGATSCRGTLVWRERRTE